MKWYFINSWEKTGKENMDFDLMLAETCSADESYFRLYRWQPYCISLGANQDSSSINLLKAAEDNIDIVKRPTGGRAVFHSEEITYSVIVPADYNSSARNLYQQINLALLNGLKKYNFRLSSAGLENVQPDFSSLYKDDISAACFAVSAKSEIKFEGKKLVGSAQRKHNNVILQHGSILCGKLHRNIVNYLNLPESSIKNISEEISEKTIELNTILETEVNYEELIRNLREGFAEYFQIEFAELLPDELIKK